MLAVEATKMNNYGITMKDDNTTFVMEADFYEIREGFVRLYKTDEAHITEEFAAYSSDCVRHIVLQE